MHEKVAESARISSVFGAFGLALLPKCPLCFAAYAGVFGAIAWRGQLFLRWEQRIFAILVGASLSCIAYLSWKRRDAAPPLLGLAGVVLLLTSELGSQPDLRFVAAALISAAAWLNAWRCRRHARVTQRAAPPLG